jgi:hypothetical protein
VARLSPIKDRQVNFVGRYLFNVKASGPGHGLRSLLTQAPPRTTRKRADGRAQSYGTPVS